MLATWGCTTFPKPTLSLDFLGATSLDSGITFSRGSQATLFDSTGTLVYAKHNLVLQSEDFATTWAAGNITVTTNSATSPSGTMTADAFNDGTATDVHNVAQTVATTTGTTYTMSAFLKNVDRQYAILACSGSTTSYASAKFDLAAGTLGSTQASGAAWSVVSSSITPVGNGWYRCTLTFVVGNTTGTSFRIGTASDGTTFTASARGLQSYTGTNASIYVWGAQFNLANMEGGVTSSLTTYYPTTTTAYYAPRFDYNPSTLQPRGLLIEEQRTNLETYSDDFSNAYWNKSNATVSSNVIIAPDGNLTGDKLITDSGLTNGQVFGTATLAASTTYTFSCFAKAGEWSWTNLATRGPENIDISAWFNLSAGTVGTVSAGVTASITPVGNGWYRCAVTRTTGTGAATSRQRIHSTNADNAYSTGDGTSGIYIWGAQLEAGAFVTSYIPTTTTALTRNADVATMTGTNFSSWYNASEGTLFGQYQTLTAGTTQFLAAITSVSEADRITVGQTATAYIASVVDTSVSQVSITQGTTSLNSAKIVFTYKINDFAFSLNGAAPGTDTVGTVPAGVTEMKIGRRGTSTSPLNGWVARLAYYPTRLPNATLQALTA